MSGVSAGGGGIPAGTIAAHPANMPTGWLECNGAAISRTLYAALFGEIGTTYGAGDGATTFNIPDLRGRFLRGLDNGAGRDSGRANGSVQGDDNKSHSHGASTNTTGSHSHTLNRWKSPSNPYVTTYHATTGLSENSILVSNDAANNASGNHAHSVSVGASGGGETRPVNMAMKYGIKY